MAKLGCGAGMLLFALILLIWIGFNLLVQRQAEFKGTVGGVLFLAGLLTVGGKWVTEGLAQLKDRPRPRPKKKRRRRPVEDDRGYDDEPRPRTRRPVDDDDDDDDDDEPRPRTRRRRPDDYDD